MCPAKGEVRSVFQESVTSLGAGCGQKLHDKITYLWDPVVHVPPPAGAPQGSVSQDLVMARSQRNERGHEDKSGSNRTDRELRSKKVSGGDKTPQTALEKVMEWLATILEGEDSCMGARERPQTE